ncbi:helix-turn-helix domain-containing protein [Kineococcus sp. R86509]|uniref:helix-turn-helix domain-containing protein n=1 Tax=Kineococcus sp. R86509 TaxID=3093851 RepID=UPI0036D29839
MDIRGADPEVDAVLVAVHLAALTWRTATGSDPRNTEEQPAEFPDMSTRVAADTLGITERGVRQAITRGHLHATRVDGRWRITRENLAHFQAARTAA